MAYDSTKISIYLSKRRNQKEYSYLPVSNEGYLTLCEGWELDVNVYALFLKELHVKALKLRET